MSDASEEVGADQVGDAGGQEGRSQLPVLRVHRVDHPDGKRRLHHGDAHVGERDRARRRQYVRIAHEHFQRGALLLLRVYARLQDQQLKD